MQHPNHPDHDLTLIAAHAAGDLSDAERTRAQARIDACSACADLHRDLIAIAVATRSLPTRAAAPRDFRIAPEQAARLARRGWLRTLLAPLGAPRSAAQPLAAAFTSLGLAGLLVATFLPGLMGSAASSTADEKRDRAALGGPTAAPAAPAATSAAQPAAPPAATSATARATVLTPLLSAASGKPVPEATSGTDNAYGVRDGAAGGASATSGTVAAGLGSTPTEAPGANVELGAAVIAPPATSNPLLIGSLALLAAGLLLFGLRFASRRLR